MKYRPIRINLFNALFFSFSDEVQCFPSSFVNTKNRVVFRLDFVPFLISNFEHGEHDYCSPILFQQFEKKSFKKMSNVEACLVVSFFSF